MNPNAYWFIQNILFNELYYTAKFLYIFPLASIASTEYTSQIYKLYICFY